MKPLRALVSERTWHYAIGFDLDVDFCFWILERDGLQIPPFDRHVEGDGLVRAAGLDLASWSSWFGRVMAAVAERHDIVTSSRTKASDFARLRALEPPALWDGAPAVGKLLVELDEEYGEDLGEREQIKLELHRVLAECGSQLWEDLARYRRVLPPVNVVVTCYPGPVQQVVPPDTVLLAVGGWEITPGGLANAVKSGMQSLVEGSETWPAIPSA